LAAQHDPSDGVAQLTRIMSRADDGNDDLRSPPPQPPVDPAVRRARRRRRALAVAVAFVAVLAMAGGYTGWALNAAVAAPTASLTPPNPLAAPTAELALPPDGVSAISVAGGEQYLGAEAAGIWASVSPDEQRTMASISKVIAALVVLERKPLASTDDEGPTITFSKSDHDLYDKYYVMNATIAAMPTGSAMTEREALETMLVISACNYAEAVTTWAFGSQSAFVWAANRWLAANGLTGTKLVEPTGINPRNVSTPVDMIALGRIAMANPVVAQIVGTQTLDVPGLGPAANTNNLLGTDGIRGIKTGTLGEDGTNLLYSASLEVGLDQPLEVTGVVLGGFSRATVGRDVVALLESIKAGFHTVQVAEKGRVLGRYTTEWGGSVRIVLAESASVFTWSDTPIEVAMETTELRTGQVGEQVGSVTWTAGDDTVTVPIVLDATIEQPDAWWRLTHPGQLNP